jgi:hypothetical protein
MIWQRYVCWALIVWAVLHTEKAVAGCTEIQAQIKSTFSDLQRAKEMFKQALLDEQKRGPANSPQEAVDGLTPQGWRQVCEKKRRRR